MIPVDFVRINDDNLISFHCAQAGEKWVALQFNPKITFSAYLPHAVIPSYWITDDNGCNASQYYKSVQIDGRVKIITDPVDKAAHLQALMEKYQPEGKYKPVTADDPLHSRSVIKTGVVAVVPESVSCKIKFGQHLPAETREKVVKGLEQRGEPIDLLTAEEIRKSL